VKKVIRNEEEENSWESESREKGRKKQFKSAITKGTRGASGAETGEKEANLLSRTS